MLCKKLTDWTVTGCKVADLRSEAADGTFAVEKKRSIDMAG